MRARFWGSRGSLAAPGPDTVRIGGNTSCIEVRTHDDRLVILDSGTGIRRLGTALDGAAPARIDILLSHLHLDHLEGLGFFAPLWDAAQGVRLGGQVALVERVRDAMERGEVSASRARTIVGYLVLTAADVPQGARRTRYELERDARRLGLGVSSATEDETVDLGAFLEECTDTNAWAAR